MLQRRLPARGATPQRGATSRGARGSDCVGGRSNRCEFNRGASGPGPAQPAQSDDGQLAIGHVGTRRRMAASRPRRPASLRVRTGSTQLATSSNQFSAERGGRVGGSLAAATVYVRGKDGEGGGGASFAGLSV